MRRRLALLAVVSGCCATACVPQLPAGYHVAGDGERVANSAEQVVEAVEALADATPPEAVLTTELPPELLRVPVPGNALARQFERSQRKADFCAGFGAALGSPETPPLDDSEDLRMQADFMYSGLHSIDPEVEYEDVGTERKRGEAVERRLPDDIRSLLPALEEVAHAYYVRLLLVEELDERGKLDDVTRAELVQRAVTEVTSAEATRLMHTVSTFFNKHCRGAAS